MISNFKFFTWALDQNFIRKIVLSARFDYLEIIVIDYFHTLFHSVDFQLASAMKKVPGVVVNVVDFNK